MKCSLAEIMAEWDVGKSTSEGSLPQTGAAALGKGSSDPATLLLLPMPLAPQIPESSNQELLRDQIPWVLQLLEDFAGRSSSPSLLHPHRLAGAAAHRAVRSFTLALKA